MNNPKKEELLEDNGKIAYYGRVSTKKQKNDSKDVKNKPRQTAIVEDFLEDRGLHVLEHHEYFDTISAYKKPFDQREEFQRLLQAARKKEIDTIIVSEADRITRQPKEHRILRKLFEQLGVKVILASDGKSYVKGDFFQQLLEDGVGKFEADNNAVRTRAAMFYLQEEGKFTGGKIPYGYEVGERYSNGKNINRIRSLRPVGDKIDVIKKIFRMYSTSESFSSIAKYLKVTRSKDEKWSANKVKSIITNPIYMGYHGYGRIKGNSGGYTFKDLNEWKLKKSNLIQTPVISEEIWMLCWKKYNENVKKPPKHLSTNFIFNGFLFCHCGSEMKGKDKRTNINGKGKEYGARWYICSNDKFKENKCKKNKCEEKKCNEKVKEEDLTKCVEAYFQSIWGQSVVFLEEIRDRIEKEVKQREQRLEDIEIQYHDVEQKVDILLELIDYEGNIKEVFLFEENSNPLYLSYLMTKERVMKQFDELEHLMKQEKYLLEKFRKCLDEKILHGYVEPFRNKPFSKLSNRAKRAFILIFLKNCQFIDSKTIDVTLYSLKNKILSL
ncbi:recombinase family protein [Neobacillus cucumis]|nr:recombinase family protein [Neobacillus cucumis]